MTQSAKPIAVSAAATVITKRANNTPAISSCKLAAVNKFILTDNSIISIHINIVMKFLRFRNVPKAPIKNKTIIVKKNKEICK
jgi:hypothetical protein